MTDREMILRELAIQGKMYDVQSITPDDVAFMISVGHSATKFVTVERALYWVGSDVAKYGCLTEEVANFVVKYLERISEESIVDDGVYSRMLRCSYYGEKNKTRFDVVANAWPDMHWFDCLHFDADKLLPTVAWTAIELAIKFSRTEAQFDALKRARKAELGV